MVTLELLVRNWVIGLEKVEETLKATTKKNVSPSLIQLTRMYCIYLISQRLRSLSCTLYTYTLFSNQKYIVGNTCAQIFIDGEGLVYDHPMQYNSQAGEDLNVVTMDIGSPNNLILYNEGEHVGPQTDIQECIHRCSIDGRITEQKRPW